MNSQPPPAIRIWPLQKYTQVGYMQTPEKSYVARTHGELTVELNLNTKTLVVKQGFCVTEEVPLLADRLPNVYYKDKRLIFGLKEPFTHKIVRKFRMNFYSTGDFESFRDSLSHFVPILPASKSVMSCATPCFSTQNFPQPYAEASSSVTSGISRNLLDNSAFPTPAYSQRTPQTQGSGTSTSRYLQPGVSQQDAYSQLSESTQRYLSQQYTAGVPQFRPSLLESSPASSQQRISQQQMEFGSAAQFLGPHSSRQGFGDAQFCTPGSNALSRTPSQHSSRLTMPSNQIRRDEPFVTPPTSSLQSQYSQWNAAVQNTIPREPQSEAYPARDSVSALSSNTATNASSQSGLVYPPSTTRFDLQATQERWTPHTPIAAEGPMPHALQTSALLHSGRDLQRGLSSSGTNTLIDDRLTLNFVPSVDARHGRPTSQLLHSSIQRWNYPGQDRSGQHEQYRSTTTFDSSASGDPAPSKSAVVQTTATTAGYVSVASSAHISGYRLEDLHQPAMLKNSHVPRQELETESTSGWLGGGDGAHQAPADDRSKWVVPPAPLDSSSGPPHIYAVADKAPVSRVPMPREEEGQLQRYAQAKITDTISGSKRTLSADPTTASAAANVPFVAYDETSELPRPQPIHPSRSPLFFELPQSPRLAPNGASVSRQSNHSRSPVPQSLTPAPSKQYSSAGVGSLVTVASFNREIDPVAWAESTIENGHSPSRDFGQFRGYEEETPSSSLTATIKSEPMDESSFVRPPQHKALLRVKGGKQSSRKTVVGGRQRKPLSEIQGNIHPLNNREPGKPINQTERVPSNGNHTIVRRRKRNSVGHSREQSTQTDSSGDIACLADDPAYVRELLANVLQSDCAGRLFQAIDEIITEINAEPANVDSSSLRSTAVDSAAAYSNDFG